MIRIEDFNDLLKIEQELAQVMDIRKGKIGDSQYKELLICGGTGCMSSQAKKLLDNLSKEIEKNGLSDKIKASITGCFGFCEKGPIVKVFPEDEIGRASCRERV